MLKKIVLSLYVLLAIAVGTGVAFAIAAKQDLPDVSLLETYKPNTITRIYDVNNAVIAEFYHQRRTIVPLSAMPDHLIKAVLAAEDANFYRHKGLDYRGIARAMLKNVASMRIKEGGSTITQQLSKQLFLTSERSLKRKMKEAMLAVRIERRYTKEEILSLYLNQVYLGSGAYGVQSAAQVYFGKDVSDLELPEAALIAGLLRAPSAYSPFLHPERARQRRGYVLQRMMQEGFISREQARQASSRRLKLALGGSAQVNRAPYFVEYIRRYLEEHYQEEDIYKNGLEVYTTLDLKLQRSAEHAMTQGLIEVSRRRGSITPVEQASDTDTSGKEGAAALLPGDILTGVVQQAARDGLLVKIGDSLGKISYKDMRRTKQKSAPLRKGDRVLVKVLSADGGSADAPYSLSIEQGPDVEGALIALDPTNGHIRAMVGGYDYYRSQFNRATQAKRQPGSAFKPIIYTAAIDKGYRPSDIILDAPIVYRDPWTGTVWKPANFEGKFFGPVTVRHALENSRNAATVNLVLKIKPDTVIDYAKMMGIESPIEPYPSIGLGSFEVSPLEITSAFGVLANNGIRAEPMSVRYITDKDGKILEENNPRLKDVLSPRTSYILTRMLEGVVQRGTGRKVRSIGVPVAGKTGTTDKFSDAWFIGYTPSLVTGVWVGMDDHTPIGNYETGSQAASPIWLRFMKDALEGLAPQDFPIPEGISLVRIDAYSGFLPNDDCKDDVIEEAFIKGTEPKEYCPRSGHVTSGPGSSELNFYRH